MKLLEKKILKLKQQLVSIGSMRPGSMSKQKRRARGTDYGEYWYLSYTFKKRGYTEYIPPELEKQIRDEIANYRRFKELSEELVEASIELSRLLIKQALEEKS